MREKTGNAKTVSVLAAYSPLTLFKQIKSITRLVTRLALLGLACCAPLYAWAEAPLVPSSELQPTAQHHKATEVIHHILKNHHYRNKPLDDAMSASIFKTYLKNLDPNRAFFLSEDTQTFAKVYKDKLDDALLKNNLRPAFNIFKTYRQRVKERVDYALARLEQDFDFTLDEEYSYDRSKLDWAASSAELDLIWDQRIKNDLLNLLLAGKEESEGRETLGKRYQRLYTNAFQFDANDVFQLFINAFTTSIEPHTSYFSPRSSENFDISMRLSLEGIGAVLKSESDYTVVQRIVPGGPADISKQLHGNDKIIGVGQGSDGEIVDIIGWRLQDVVELIRGPKGTVVRLEIIPEKTVTEDMSETITLVRNKIKLEESAAKSSIIDMPDLDAKIGVIDIPTFYMDFAAQARGDKNYRSTSRDVRELISALKKQEVDGIIIDLRGNGGGSLTEALAMTGLFIRSGPVVQTKTAAGKVEVNHDPDPSLFYAGPLAVLVDRHSASASEIFSGAIQDYQRGIVIGEPTYGKGTVQNIIDINHFIKNAREKHGKLKTTVAQFYRISGGSNQNKGVVPDIVFPTARSSNKYGERALDNALPWDKIPAAEYVKTSAPVELYGKARALHEQRVESDHAFELLLEQLKLIKKTNDKKSISLQKSKRQTARDELAQMKRELENELRVVQGLEPLPEEETASSDTASSDVQKNADETEEENKLLDVLLQEAAHILDDLITLSNAGSGGLQVNKDKQPYKL